MFIVTPILAVIAGVLFAANHFRNNVEENPDEWHVDPLTAPSTGKQNWSRRVPADAPVERDPKRDRPAPTFDVSAAELGAAFDAVARGDERVEVLAGSVADGHVTYVQRSNFFRFPDYVSVRFVDEPGTGSTLAIYSRARFGQKDFDVNEKRITRWLDQLTPKLA